MADPKAILIEKFVTSFEELTPVPIPYPKPYTPSTLLVQVSHAALTHVDALYARGKHQNNRSHARPPFVLGTEFVGTVIQSPAFSRYKPGDRVFGSAFGTFAEVIAVEERQVRKVPKRWTNREACAVGASGAVSWGCLVGAGRVERGETILVLGGAGGLGVMAVQVAMALGCRVIGAVGEKEKARVVRGLGVEDVVGYDYDGWEEKVKELTEGEGVDVVFDAVGRVESGLRCLRYGGRVVVVGYAGRGGKMEKIPANRILLKGATVVGYRFGEHGRRFPNEQEAIWESFMAMVEDGSIQPVPYAEEYKGLEDVARGLGDVESRKVWGRAVVTLQEGSAYARNDRALL